MLNGWLFIHKQGFKPISRLDAHSAADDNILVFGADPMAEGVRKNKKQKGDSHL